jgi:nucleoside-diphosphate-sugar epimerase
LKIKSKIRHMRVFVTGATGFIGSAIVKELITAGHQVLGLSRSDAGATKLQTAGAEVLRGDLQDLESLKKGAREADGVIHTAFIHDFSKFAENAAIDLKAVQTMLQVLEGTSKPFVLTSGLLGLKPGEEATEDDAGNPAGLRTAAEVAALDAAKKGVRTSIIRLPPSVHGEGDHGFVPIIINIARQRRVSGYIGDGTNVWPTVHRLDAANLYRLALEKAPAGSVLHGVAEEGVQIKAIAEVIGKHLNIPVSSQPAENFDFLGNFLGFHTPVSSKKTKALLGWTPTQVELIPDLDQGHYFRV